MYLQVSKSSSDFWNNIKLTWQQCADLPVKCWATSVAELDGKVYFTSRGDGTYYDSPLIYDSYKDQWFALPSLPHVNFSLVVIPNKKQLLAIGGVSDGEVSGQVFAWEEDDQKWTTPYPNMPTARYGSCGVSHKSVVIVAGGVTCCDPLTKTGAVEVLHIDEHGGSCWTKVEQFPYVAYDLVPVVIDDVLYIGVGFDDDDGSTCNIATASLPDLIQRGVRKTRSGRLWNKMPDMPYSSWSINQYQGRLIIFTGDYRVEQPGQTESSWQLISQIHLYNPGTKSWDHVGEVPYNYLMGRSAHIRENKILFISGLTGTHAVGKGDDMLTRCVVLTLTPK